MRFKVLSAACLVLAVLPFAPARAQEPVGGAVAARPAPALERIESRVREHLEELQEKGAFAGASLALVLEGGREVNVAVGLASRADKTPLKVADRFLSGSIGKTYLAAAILRLARTDELALDDKIAKWLGGEEWFERLANAESITVRHLMRHQSGVSEYVYGPGFHEQLTGDRDHVWKPEELVAHVLDVEPLFVAGEGWSYADTNYILLGMVLERATGAKWYDHARAELIEPLGLKDTVASDTRRIPGLVQGHVVIGRAFGLGEYSLEDGVYGINPQFEWCGGGWASTAPDLARWGRALYAGGSGEGEDLLTAKERAEMLEAVSAPRLGAGVEYGLGVIVAPTPFGPVHGHDGFMPGYLSSMGWFPDARIAGALMINSDDPRAVGRSLRDVLADLAGIAREELVAK